MLSQGNSLLSFVLGNPASCPESFSSFNLPCSHSSATDPWFSGLEMVNSNGKLGNKLFVVFYALLIIHVIELT